MIGLSACLISFKLQALSFFGICFALHPFGFRKIPPCLLFGHTVLFNIEYA